MARKKAPTPTPDEIQELFSKVDETGHNNEDNARRQHRHRKEKGTALDVDPLSNEDPSGSNVEKIIAKTAIAFVVVLLVVVVLAQVSCGVARRANTANLSENVTVKTVSSALKGGVEWGNGFTQFPEDFTVQEADENTGRVEVTVTDTSSEDAMECFAGSQIQATAFAINALLNPNIDVVIYHVDVHVDSSGNFEKSAFFGFLQPTGDLKSFMTFIWTKNTSSSGVNFTCTITGVDSDIMAELKDKVTSTFTSNIFGTSTTTTVDTSESATTTDAASSASTDASTSTETTTGGE